MAKTCFIRFLGLLVLLQSNLSYCMYCNMCYSTSSWEDCKNNWTGQQACGAATRGNKCYHTEHQYSSAGQIGNMNILVECFHPDTATTYCDDMRANAEHQGYSLPHCLVEECPPDVCQAGFGPICSDCSSSESMADCTANQKSIQCVQGARCATLSLEFSGGTGVYKKACALSEQCTGCSVPFATCDLTCCDADYCNTQ